jgi:hypothetical protein
MSVLELRNPEREAREEAERAALVRDGAMGTKRARTFLGDVGNTAFYEIVKAHHVRSIRHGRRRVWPVAEMRWVLRERLVDHE